MSLNDNLVVDVSTDAPPVPATGFGRPLYVATPGTLGVGFTERVRLYSDVAGLLTDLAAGDITQPVVDAVGAVLAQTRHVSQVAVGRADAGAVGSYTVTIAGTVIAGEVFSVNVDGYVVTHTVGTGAPTPTTVADAINTLIDALVTSGDLPHLTTSPAAGVITLTPIAGSIPIKLLAPTTDSAAGTITSATAVVPGDIADEMSAILDENTTWYVFANETKNVGTIDALDAWAESNQRIHIAQCSAPDIITSATTDIASELQALLRLRTWVEYHPINAEEFALCLAGKTLATDPDAGVTTWAYKSLSGITKTVLSTTEKTNLLGKNGNYYGDFFTFGASFEGKSAAGRYNDVQLTLDWIASRIQEGQAQLLLDTSNAGTRVNYDNNGISQYRSVTLAPFLRGESIGHFVNDSSSVTAPLLVDVAPADRADRILRLDFETVLTGAIHGSVTTGYVRISV